MILDFDGKQTNNKMGNKARNLIDMKAKGFNVPNGFVLDSDIYDTVLEENGITKKVVNLLHKLTKDNIEEISNKIIKLFNKVLISDKLTKDISKRLKNDTKYAVRSSGTKEDLEGYSFAGQYETFLNVSGIDNVKESIIGCYKSMFTPVLLSYLLDNEINLDDLKMAVVVQEMVDSKLSGICFTVNPLTGEDTHILVEVAPGLGENIVSGKVNPEQYEYDWYNEKYYYDENNKLLKKNTLKGLFNVALEIEKYYGYPCDIEFAITDKIYILQARAITKIKYSKIKDLWSTADFKDGGVSATVCTPFMWSLYEYIWEFTLRKFILDSKILKEKDINKKLGQMFYGRPYWNMSVVKHAMSQVPGYKEREFDSEYGVKITYEGDGDTTSFNPLSIIKIARIALAQSKILKTRNMNADNYKEDLLNKYYTYLDKLNTLEGKKLVSEWYKLTHDLYLQSESTYFWQIFINTIHQTLYKDSLLKYVNESEYLSLLGGIDNISHLVPFYEMWDITRNIKNDKNSLEYWTTKSKEEIVKNLHLKKNYLKEVNEFINKYGYHSDKELDVTYPCYSEVKETVVKMFQDTLALSDEFSPIKDKEYQKKLYEQELNKIREKVSPKKFKKIETKITNMRKMLWWREEFRDISTRFYYLIRLYTLKLAKYFKDENIISNPDDIWYLKVGDIWDYLDKIIDKRELNEIITKNRTYYDTFRNFMSENEIGSILDKEGKIERKDGIYGLGCNNGIVTSKACVIESLEEIDRLQEGDILVTKFTDTGWTSKFALLSGIVTEYGGILCHAAIVSREYGIPCIVCAHDVMKKIKDGSTITIDGTTGEIKIVKE